MKNVPPELIYPEGISWLATQYGKPLSKFVRDGLKVSVCVLRGEGEIDRPVLFVDIGNDEFAEVTVSIMSARKYDSKPRRRWEAKTQQKVSGEVRDSSGNGSKASIEVEVTPGSPNCHPAGGGEGNLPKIPEGMEGEPSQQGNATETPVAEVASLSPKSARKKKGKVSKGSNASSSQPLIITPEGLVAPGNGAESPLGEEAPPGDQVCQVAGGGLGNSSETSPGVNGEPKQQQATEASQVEVSLLSSNGNDALGSFMATKKVFVSPVKGCVLTRQQQNRRKK
ncbi:hypothetical protein LINPERPRIM_LOCUS37765 [Linum perenne]